MIRTYLVPLIAIAGVCIALYTVIQNSKPPMPTPPVVEPPVAPFASFIAGSGLVEPSSQNINIGSPLGGVVVEVAGAVGDAVKSGDKLFRLDDREMLADIAVRESQLRVAQSQLERLMKGTRPEEIPPAQARLTAAEATLADLKNQLTMWENVKDPRAVSEDDLSRRRFAVQAAQARVEELKAALALLQAGSWDADIAVARSQVESARAALESARTELERRTIRAPIAGRLLQVNIRAGEFAQAGPLVTPLMILGAVDPLHVRVDVDENDAWRVKAGAPAEAFVRGNKDLTTPLTFVRFEPYVIPKRSLTGDSTERVDTRVLQIVYKFDSRALPVYVGQQMDVYIEAEPVKKTTTPTPATPAPHAAPAAGKSGGGK